MIFQSPGPILCELGSLTVRWYGLLTALAFLVAYTVATRLAKSLSEPIVEDELSDFAITILVSGLVGARLWFVILNWEYFYLHPLEIPQIWLGGQSIQGGLLGAFLGSYLLKSKSYYFKSFSLIVTVLPLAQAIGRWGNFFNEEAYGSVTQLPWGLYISSTGQYHHPTFLYESIWDLIIFVVLYYLFKNFYDQSKRASLRLIASYLILYSIGRLVIESIRTDSLMIGALPAATVISLLSIGIAVVLLLISRLVRK